MKLINNKNNYGVLFTVYSFYDVHTIAANAFESVVVLDQHYYHYYLKLCAQLNLSYEMEPTDTIVADARIPLSQFSSLTTLERIALTPSAACIVFDTDDGESYEWNPLSLDWTILGSGGGGGGESTSKVKVDSSDIVEQFLGAKLVPGDNITITKVVNAGVESLRIAAVAPQGWNHSKKIVITSPIASNTVINANVASSNYTILGDTVDFGLDADVFNANRGIYVVYNGVDLEKGIDFIYSSATSFKIPQSLDVNDVLIIMFY